MTLLAVAESLVPVASKNTRNGEIPVARTTEALSRKLPLIDAQVGPAVAVSDPVLDELELLALAGSDAESEPVSEEDELELLALAGSDAVPGLAFEEVETLGAADAD